MNELIINGIDHSKFDLEWAKRGGVLYAKTIGIVGTYVQWEASKTGFAVLTKAPEPDERSMMWFAKKGTDLTIEFESIFRMATPNECIKADVEYIEPPMRWRPIETAPKDGTIILGSHSTNYGVIGYGLPKSVSYRTYHPNAEGKKTWRDEVGNKCNVNQWQPLPKE